MKKFYRLVVKEYLNDALYPNDVHYSKIEYGTPPENYNDVITSYDDLVDAIRSARKDRESQEMRDLYIKKCFGKYVVYSGSRGWIEEGQFGAGKISRKEFKQYRIEYKYEELNPTLKQLITEVPFSCLEQYFKDRPSTLVSDLEAYLKAWVK